MARIRISALTETTLNGTDFAPVVQNSTTFKARITALPTGSNDNVVLRSDGTGGFKGQVSAVSIDDSGNIAPIATDGGALGTTALRWSDAFLATGANINIAGDWIATHTAGILTVGTGDLRVTTVGTNSASVVTVGGTQTLTNKTLTSPTISGATLSSPTITGSPTAAGATWANLGSVTTIDINGGTVDGAIIGGASAAAITGTLITGSRFVPNSSTVPTNGLYLPAANTLGWAINSAAELQLTATALAPAADGGNSLGTTALAWQNLFGNIGFVINIEAGDWVATHTTGILTVGTGDLRVTTAGTNSASVVTIGGTQTLTNKSIAIGQITGLGTGVATMLASATGATATITFVIDGAGSVITTGIKGDLEIPFACTITRATLLADQSGSIVVNVWKDTYANYPPDVTDKITASAPPTISTATKSQDATLTGWTTSIAAGDTLRFNVDSVTTITRVTISLRVTKV